MQVFISYQRADTAYAAHLLRYAMQHEHRVFIDTGDIAVGDAFRDVIRGAVASSELVLALVGAAFEPQRLHEPSDAVAFEWRQARFLGCRVHPVLVDDAQMLLERQLPPDLRWFPGQNASRLSRQALTADVAALLRAVPALAAPPRGVRRVLWVDDKPANNERERAELRASGIAFDNVVSTREAIEQLRLTTYDLVITDLGRGWSSDRSHVAGADLIADPVLSQGGPPVLVYAGRQAADRRTELRRLGAYGVATDRQDLYDLVAEVLGLQAVEDGRDRRGVNRTPGRTARA